MEVDGTVITIDFAKPETSTGAAVRMSCRFMDILRVRGRCSSSGFIANLIDADGLAEVRALRHLRKLDEAATSAKEFAEELKENPSLLIRANDGDPLPETQR